MGDFKVAAGAQPDQLLCITVLKTLKVHGEKRVKISPKKA
jgi:hypothetical protein